MEFFDLVWDDVCLFCIVLCWVFQCCLGFKVVQESGFSRVVFVQACSVFLERVWFLCFVGCSFCFVFLGCRIKGRDAVPPI